MNGTTRTAHLALVFLFIGSVVCVADDAAQQPSKAKREAAEAANREEQITKLNLPEDTTPRFTVKEVRISGNTLISTAELLKNIPLVYNASDKQLHQAESSYLYDLRTLRDIILQPGRPGQVSTRTIRGFTQYILSAYLNKNYAGIYVYVPEEAIKDGTELQDGILPVEVLEAKVTEVKVTAYDVEQNRKEKGFLRSSVVEDWSPVKTGQIANKKKLDYFVNLLNLNPDRYVSAAVSKGAEPNSLAVGYDIYEANPWHYFIQVDNAGTKDRQWNPRIGLINTNLFGIDDRFTIIYQAPWEKGIENEYSLYGSYDFPIRGPRLRLNLYGGYSQFDITPDAGGIGFIGNGSFYGGVLRYNAFQKNGWFFDVIGSLSHERSKITPSLFPSALGTDVKMDLFGAGINVHRSDDMSNTSLAFTRIESISASSGSEFTKARTNTDPDFSIYATSAVHSQYLDPDKIGRLSGTFRWITSNERLVPAKMTTFGGLYSVRGYKEDEIVADGGILLSAQYEFDLVGYDRSGGIDQTESEQGEKPFLRKLAPLAFIDYGRAKIEDAVAGERKHQTLFSVGAGVIVELEDNFSAGAYYGHPLRPTDDTNESKGRFYFSFIKRF